jgi:uncharacterized glyoxalase superfamily protein PhnB
MKDTPKGWPRISSALFYDEPAKAIDWLCHAFGFEVRLKVEGDAPGSIVHSELTFGDGLIMVGGNGAHSKRPESAGWRKHPRELGGANTQSLMAYVDDVEAHCQRARAAGAKILMEPTTEDYGEDYWSDRGYECEDVGGHHWWFVQRLRSPQ